MFKDGSHRDIPKYPVIEKKTCLCKYRYWKFISLYTCMQSPRLRTVYKQWKQPLPAPVLKIMVLGCKIMALGCQVFHYSIKCFEHGPRGFINVVQRYLATRIVTMLTSCWQVLSEVEWRRIFDVCKRWANSSFACICKEKKDANPLRLSIVLSHHMHRNWIGKSEAECHWL